MEPLCSWAQEVGGATVLLGSGSGRSQRLRDPPARQDSSCETAHAARRQHANLSGPGPGYSGRTYASVVDDPAQTS